LYFDLSSRQLYDRIFNAILPLYDADEARSIALYLLETQAKLSRSQILAGADLKEDFAEAAEGWIARLLRHEPVQYVAGEADFCGRLFQVDKNVLIPRPETEELAAWVQENVPDGPLRLLDVGTGSGCIAVTLASALPQAEVWAVDVSPGALAVARRNAERHGAEICFVQADFLSEDAWAALPGAFNVVVSNPPYVTPVEKNDMRPNVLNHEPHTALFVPANDPLVFYRKIALFCSKRLSPGGSCFVEANEHLTEQTADLFRTAGMNATVRRDLFGRPRMVGAVK
jgi:release factor glutamine methyltransferase